MQKATICINKNTILQGGKPCKNPKITWTGSGETCLIVNCEKDECLTVQIPEGCDDKCITFIVDCDDCDECPPQIITRCLCDDGECPPCFECIDGFCQPKPCPDGQFCDPNTGDCVECVADVDCPCNQICVQGECGCPPGTIEHPVTQCCVQCVTADDCEGCDVCLGGNCIPKSCPDGVLNPNTCNCQECLIADDCDKDNECCVQGICRCCPGFIRNPITGECDPEPPCTTDDDCPECFICTPQGCVPLVCPPGTVCVDGRCETECVCPSGSCPPGRACTEVRPGVCICIPTSEICSGPCDTGNDCDDPRCGCINNQCVFIGPPPPPGGPCVGPCSDGNDCAPGCGCFEGQCIPCTSVNCLNGIVDCPDGCFCNDGVCDENPCAEVYCENSNDCGQGCGCDQNLGLCVPCSSLDCLTTECADIEGCGCVGNNCVDDGNDPTDPSNCTDEFFWEKGDCDLTIKMETESCCQCETLSVDQRLNVASFNAQLDTYTLQNVRLVKDGLWVENLPELLNEAPQLGTLQYRVVDTYIQVNNIGAPTGASATFTHPAVNQNVNSSPSNFTVALGNLPKPNITLNNNDIAYLPFSSARLATRRIELITTQDIIYRNECRYRITPHTTVYNFASTSNIPLPGSNQPIVNKEFQRLVVCRAPIFNIYRQFGGTPSTAGAPLLQVYGEQISPNTFSYTIPPSLQIGGDYVLQYANFYTATSDCGCKPIARYSCFGPNGAATPLVFCDPPTLVEGVDFKFAECGTIIEFLRDIPVACEVYTNAGNPKPVYDIFLNGQLVQTRTLGTAPATNTLLFQAGQQLSLPNPDYISTFEVRIRLDQCNECPILNTNPTPELEVTFDVFAACSTAGQTLFTYTITGGSGPFLATISRANGTIIINQVTHNSPGTYQFIWNDVVNDVFDLEVIDTATECTISVLYPINTFANLGNVSYELSCNGLTPLLTVTNNNLEAVQVELFDDVTPVLDVTVPAGSTESFIVPAGITFSIDIKGVNSECNLSGTIGPITCCINSPINNPNATVTYNCPTGWVFSNLPSGTVVTGSLNGGSPITLTAGTPADVGNWVITLTLNGCSRSFNRLVPQCYDCDDNECVAASPNIGPFSSLSQCEANCGCSEPVCAEQYLYVQDRISSVRIDGVDYDTIDQATSFSCDGLGNLSVLEGNLIAIMTAVLVDSGECNINNVVIEVDCVEYNGAKDPNNCTDQLAPPPFWARVTIKNATQSVDGWTANFTCFIPSEKNC